MAILAGCGDLQPGAVQAGAPFAAARRDNAKGGKRVFFSAIDSGHSARIFIFTYPDLKLVSYVQGVTGSGLCTDHQGNVWVATGPNIEEISYDGALLGIEQDRYGLAFGCAVDIGSDTLALTNSNGNVVLLPGDGSQSGIAYPTGLTATYYCAYDNQGNLFVTGLNGQKPELLELPSGKPSFTKLSIDKPIDGAYDIEWDGSHLALEASHKGNVITIYQLSVAGNQATVTQTTHLAAQDYRFWPQGYQFAIAGGTVLQSAGHNSKRLELWHYPAGGNAYRHAQWKSLGISHIGALTLDSPGS